MDKYFNQKDADGYDKKPYPTYFYLDWNKKKAEWRTIQNSPDQKKLKFTSTVRWKELKNLNINICTNYLESDADFTALEFENQYSNVSYLKSHLQKSIRRSDVWRTLKTAYHMMLLDLQSFLRRLGIIAIEDSVPVDGFNMLVWFTAAVSKGYKLSSTQKCWCLGYAMKLAESKLYDPIASITANEFDITKNKLYRLSQEHADLIYSLQFRKAYGGMGGDKLMLNIASNKWIDRFNTGIDVSYLLVVVPFVLPPIEMLDQNEWILAAIDYHCCPSIVNNILMAYDDLTEDIVRKAIWHYSSSVTNKQCCDGTPFVADNKTEELHKVWIRIRKKFLNMAAYMLKLSI